MNREYKAFGSAEDNVIQECSEVIQTICKAKNFGYKNYYPDTPTVCNAELILGEIYDLQKRLDEYKPLLRHMIIQFTEERKSETNK